MFITCTVLSSFFFSDPNTVCVSVCMCFGVGLLRQPTGVMEGVPVAISVYTKMELKHCVVQLFYMFLRLSRTVCFTQSLDSTSPSLRRGMDGYGAVPWVSPQTTILRTEAPPRAGGVTKPGCDSSKDYSLLLHTHIHTRTRSQLHFVRERLALIEKISAQINLFTARHTRGEARLSGVSCHHTLYHLLQSQWWSCL